MLRGDVNGPAQNFGNDNAGIIGDGNKVGEMNSNNTTNSHNMTGSVGGNYGNSVIRTGDGDSGGRGGDIGSHNSIRNSNYIDHTTINFYGPQFIVNPEGKSLDLSTSDGGRSVNSHPFHGGSNQQWTLQDDGAGKFALKSEYNGLFVSVKGSQQDSKLFASNIPFYWNISRNDGTYKLIASNTGLALCLDSSANLRPPIDKSTSVYVLEDTPENREAIKTGKSVPAKPLVASDQKPLTIPGGNLNVTINDFSGPSSVKVADALKDLQNFLASDTAKNLVIFLGTSQPPSLSPSSDPARSVDSLAPYKVNSLLMRGFPTGLFRIRASGSQNYWSLRGSGAECNKDGNPIILWPFVAQLADQQTFFVNSMGALCCQKSDGIAVDLIGNALAISHNRPMTLPWPNPWSHPLPIFSYSHETRTISVEPRVDPLVSFAWPRPDNQWKDRESVVSARCPMNVTIPKFDQIVQWAPNASYSSKWTYYWGAHRLALEQDALGVEDKKSIGSTDQERVMWEIEMVV